MAQGQTQQQANTTCQRCRNDLCAKSGNDHAVLLRILGGTSAKSRNYSRFLQQRDRRQHSGLTLPAVRKQNQRSCEEHWPPMLQLRLSSKEPVKWWQTQRHLTLETLAVVRA